MEEAALLITDMTKAVSKEFPCLPQPLYSYVSAWQAWLYNKINCAYNTPHLQDLQRPVR